MDLPPATARVPFEMPDPSEWWLRLDLANEALRVARVLAGL
ncbi:hypothetical protein [Subtercola boreus]|nr:hypothetical protein [Subtercola boreus]